MFILISMVLNGKPVNSFSKHSFQAFSVFNPLAEKIFHFLKKRIKLKTKLKHKNGMLRKYYHFFLQTSH